MYWTDNKGKWQQDDLAFEGLKPAHPHKSKVEVIVIRGDFKGQTFKVDKVNRAGGTVVLANKPVPLVWQVVDLCMLEPHLAVGCTCSRLS